MLIKPVIVFILSFKCLVIANLKLNAVQSVDHEDEHNKDNEPDEVGSNDLKCQNLKGRNTTG